MESLLADYLVGKVDLEQVLRASGGYAVPVSGRKSAGIR
jgi:hypothetical protein